MTLNIKDRENWTKYMIGYFESNKYILKTSTENNVLIFNVKNILGTGITLNNQYGIIRLFFNDEIILNQFMKIAAVEYFEEKIDIPQKFKHLLDSQIKETDKSENLPCKIYRKENSFSFYDLEETLNNVETFNNRKTVFMKILSFIEQFKREDK